MKRKLFKLANGLLTVLIMIQAVICLLLMFRTVSNKDFALFGYRFYYIVSPSMEPVIRTGSEIVVKEVDIDSLKEGDIITFKSKDPSIKGYPNTHRILRITTDKANNLAFVTKGDNNPTEDQYLVYPEDIYGKVVVIKSALRGLIMFYSFAATPVGFMVVVIMPLLFVFASFMRSFIQEMKAAASSIEMADTPAEMQKENVEAMVFELVKEYMEAHPDEEFTTEQAIALAASLLEEAKNKGKESEHGEQT